MNTFSGRTETSVLGGGGNAAALAGLYGKALMTRLLQMGEGERGVCEQWCLWCVNNLHIVHGVSLFGKVVLRVREVM